MSVRLNWTELKYKDWAHPGEKRLGLKENSLLPFVMQKQDYSSHRYLNERCSTPQASTLLWLKGAYCGQIGANNLYKIWPGQLATLEEFWPQILVQIKLRNPWEASAAFMGKLVWAKGNFQQTLLWIPSQKYIKFIGSHLKRVCLVLSVEAWAKSWRPDAISGIARNPEGLAQDSCLSCSVNTHVCLHIYSPKPQTHTTHRIITHMCS